MPKQKDEDIKARAYSIWEEEGRPEGRHHDHWSRAESEISGNSDAVDGAEPKQAKQEEIKKSPAKMNESGNADQEKNIKIVKKRSY